jgi:hypothetical protein
MSFFDARDATAQHDRFLDDESSVRATALTDAM